MVQSPRTAATDLDPALTALQEAWAGKWKIWRARKNPHLDVRNGDYYASRMDDTAGIHQTVVGTTPAELDRALHAEDRLVKDGAQPLTLSHFGLA